MGDPFERSGGLMSELNLDPKTGRKFYSKRSRRCIPVVVVVLTFVSLTTSICTVVLYYSVVASRQSASPPPSSQLGQRHPFHSSPQEPAYAHKTLLVDFSDLTSSTRDSRSVQPREPDDFHQLHIDTENQRYEMSQGVNLLAGGIEIKYSGTYFVYKSIFFAPYSRGECRTFKYKSFSSRLTVRRRAHATDNPTTTCLLRSVHTCCPSCRDNTETAFTGGSFHLNKGDLIQVDVTANDVIDLARDVTFMGLMSL